MTTCDPTVYRLQTGRHFCSALADGDEISAALARLIQRLGLGIAAFGVTGRVGVATMGIYDPAQQVWVTRKETGGADIVYCRGDVVLDHGRPLVCGQILLADGTGRLFGGRLFSQTLVHAAEVWLMELIGTLPARRYDPITAMWRLPDTL